MKFSEIKTPCYVLDEKALRANLEILAEVERESGAHILLAQKAFSMFDSYKMVGKYISGTTASGLYEARLGYEEMGKQNHVFAPAYKDGEIDEIAEICDHVVFNSISQLCRYGNRVAGKASIGIRINPEISTQEGHEIYDPCAPGSRLGITRANLDKALGEDESCLALVDGIHFHTLCEQNSDDLKTTLEGVIARFEDILSLDQIKWVNFGGGHHITKATYDRELLVSLVKDFRARFGVEVYLEPGEAIALNAGYLVTEVMDIVDNDIKVLILDASAACHMPDVLEMPYRPPLQESGEWGDEGKHYEYRLSSLTCLAGDIIGDYSFDHEIKVGDRLVFEDMAIYSMVKNNTFNGIALPNIYSMDENGECRLVKEFGYEDFKGRLS